MALYRFLKSSRSPEEDLKEAVISNNLADLSEALKRIPDINARLQRQGGNTALHFAAHGGFVDAIDILLKAGANPDVLNDHGNPPVREAIVQGHAKVVIRLMMVCPGVAISHSNKFPIPKIHFEWRRLSEEIKTLLIKSSPCVQFYGCTAHAQPDSLTQWKILILCGIDLNRGNAKSLLDCQLADDACIPFEYGLTCEQFSDWLSDFQRNPLSLQQHCRLTIRRSFHGNCNVFYGAQHLNLPHSLKDFICMFSKELVFDIVTMTFFHHGL